MFGYFRSQISEIQNSFELRMLGLFLSLTHLATAILWVRNGALQLMTTENFAPLCWPYYPTCGVLHFDSENSARLALTIYGTFATLVALMFLFKRFTALAFMGSIALLMGKYFFLFQEYRLNGNYHYMPLFLQICFLFLPQKVIIARGLIVLFYFFAGLLKLNFEWLSGSAIPLSWIRPNSPASWVYNQGFLPLACAAVVFLELILSFSLLSRRRIVFFPILLAFLLFHIFSYWIVGWFYPVIMLLLLSFLVVCFFSHQEGPPQVKSHFKQITIPVIIFIGFSLLQIYPRLLPGDTDLHGYGHFFALNMFDSLSECQSKAIAIFNGKQVEMSLNPKDQFKNVRSRCIPHFYLMRGKQLCEELATDPSFQRLKISLVTKRSSDAAFQKVIELENACEPKHHISIIWPQNWVEK